VEWALRLPENISSNRTEGKLVLKALARKYLPASVIDRPKMGFAIPINGWFKGELQPMLRDTLLSKRARERGLFDPSRVEAMISDHVTGRDIHGFRLWALLCLELWFVEVVEARP
ncbi:MAG: asparagine synthetase B, partial [Vicinamibacteria bacterium]|nr:asparagine synthetase B [Vicinamibacteria bacterium]